MYLEVPGYYTFQLFQLRKYVLWTYIALSFPAFSNPHH